MDAEDAYVHSQGLDGLTKIALARQLERHLEEPRRQAWQLSLEALRERARPFVPEPAEEPQEPQAAPVPRARGGGEPERGARGAQGRGRQR